MKSTSSPFVPTGIKGSTGEKYRTDTPDELSVHGLGFYAEGSALVPPPEVGTDRGGESECRAFAGLVAISSVIDDMVSLIFFYQLVRATISVTCIIRRKINGIIIFRIKDFLCLNELTMVGKLDSGVVF